MPLEAFRKANVASMAGAEPLRSDVPMPEKWPEQMKARYMGVGRPSSHPWGSSGKIRRDATGIK